ncbi:Daunorubicin/doxorubicin resistance ATP-binding protein DrrA [compost metagenome]
MTVIYTTHYMEEVEAISSRIMIMDHGAIIAEGTKEKLKESIQHEKSYFIEVDHTQNIKEDDFFRIEGVKSVQIEDQWIKIVTLREVENLDRIITLLVDQHVQIINISSEIASLETVFLKLTGRKLRD